MYLIVTNSLNDPVVKAIENKKSNIKQEVLTITLKDLLNNIDIFDVIEDGKPTLQWTLKSGQIITNSSQTTLINRALQIPDSLFDDFHEEDKSYAKKEFQAYLSFALEAFPNKLTRPGPYGLAGNVYPLPIQWEKIKEINKDLNTTIKIPEYYYGPVKHCPYNLSANDSNWTVSDPYDFYNWKTSNINQTSNKLFFCHSRPEGDPTIALISGSRCLLYSQKLQLIIKNDLISDLAFKITNHFNLPISELLFFVTEKSITFGMISNQLRGVKNLPEFEDHLIEGILKC